MILEPVEFLRRIAALIPPRRFHGIRYHGLFSAASIDRAKACALAPPVDPAHPGAGVPARELDHMLAAVVGLWDFVLPPNRRFKP